MEPGGSTSIKVIGKAGRLLRVFLEEGAELHLQRLAEIAKLDVSTASRIAASLADIGLLRFDAIQRTYSPGLLVSELSQMVLSRFGYRELIHRELLSLSAEHDWVCYLSVPDESAPEQVLYADVVSTHPADELRASLGQRRLASQTSSGRVLLAEGVIDPAPFIEEEGPELATALREIIANGYASSIVRDQMGVSVPLRGATGRVVATISAAIPAERAEAERDLMVSTLQAKARGLSSMLVLSVVDDIGAHYTSSRVW